MLCTFGPGLSVIGSDMMKLTQAYVPVHLNTCVVILILTHSVCQAAFSSKYCVVEGDASPWMQNFDKFICSTRHAAPANSAAD
jgi:hypothetical protein